MHGPAPHTPGDTKRPSAGTPWSLLALLITMTAIGPLTLNILMPAVPGLVAALDSDVQTVQLTLTLYLLGMAVSQLALGSLSDRFGRRPVILVGLALTALTSFAALAVSTIHGLILVRTLQSIGSPVGMVIGRAIIRDLFDRDRAAAMIGWVTAAMVIAPMISPTIGGLLDTQFGWRAVFLFVGVFSLGVTLWAAFALPETRAVSASGGGFVRFVGETRALLTSRSFLGYAFAAAFCSAMFFVVVGGAPHVVVTMMGRSSAEYGLWFALGAGAYMVGNFLVANLAVRYGLDAMVRWGLLIGLFGAALTVPVVWYAPDSPAAFFIPNLIVCFANGLLMPNAIAGAISAHPQAAGTASGITGFLQMGIGAGSAQLVSHLLSELHSAMPMVWMIFLFGAAATVSFFALSAKRRAG